METKKKRSLLARTWSATWQGVETTRRALWNLIFLALVVALGVSMCTGGPKPLADKTALLLALKGPLVDQTPGDAQSALMRGLQGEEEKSVQLRDVLRALDAAAKDPKIASVVMVLDDFAGGGMANLREVAAAIEHFKASGKKVVAWGSSLDQRQFFLAAQAHEVYLHPQGMVLVEGMGRYRNYYRDALDKLGVTVNVIKTGTYKNAPETYVANAPSPASTEAEAYVFNALWNVYTRDVEKARKLAPGSIQGLIDALPAELAQVGGDVAQLAVKAKWVDGLKTRDELRTLMIERGTLDAQTQSFAQVSFAEYLARQKPQTQGDAVGVLVAQGDIIDGEAAPGTVGGLSTAALVRKAREDERIKAIVLRVNSPGGSVFGSELVRRELELARKAGKPVVVSMGDVAASGGYWISTNADEILADEATITGSIGAYVLLPTFDKTLDKVGVHTAGVTTTWLAGAYDPRRPLDPRFAAVVQASNEHTYRQFTTLVAKARKTTPEEIDKVAQGRVWTGAQALERKLIDRLGNQGDAVAAAAKLAKLPENARIEYLEREPGRLEKFLKAFGDKAMARWVQSAVVWMVGEPSATAAVLPRGVARDIATELSWLADVRERRSPFSAVAHCLCEAP
jgi:protease-4